MMQDPFAAWLNLSTQVVDAQSKALGAGQAGVTVQKAMMSAAEANMTAWQSWAKLWGVR